jgi:RNA polymerase sigma-70 factor, ECF subfamily
MSTRQRAATHLIGMLPRLRRYARVLTVQPDAADDLVADTLTRARDTTRGTPERSSTLSMMAIMHRLYHSQRERGGTERASPRAPALPVGAGARAAGIVDLLWELPVEEREILMLVAVERLSYDEVATLLEVPPATVIARLTRARANLRALMAMPAPGP